jgi:hypothetical protein
MRVWAASGVKVGMSDASQVKRLPEETLVTEIA